jgi:hypothetical protein
VRFIQLSCLRSVRGDAASPAACHKGVSLCLGAASTAFSSFHREEPPTRPGTPLRLNDFNGFIFPKSLREIRTGEEQYLKGSKNSWSRMENASILYRRGLRCTAAVYAFSSSSFFCSIVKSLHDCNFCRRVLGQLHFFQCPSRGFRDPSTAVHRPLPKAALGI